MPRMCGLYRGRGWTSQPRRNLQVRMERHPIKFSALQICVSARRAGQLADRPAAPRVYTLEQTPLIRDAVSASEMLTQDPKDRKELRREA